MAADLLLGLGNGVSGLFLNLGTPGTTRGMLYEPGTASSAAPPRRTQTRKAKNVKIAVIGGTGLIGSQVVRILNASGHEAVPHSPSTGVDLLSGQGPPEALNRADVVVNLTNSPSADERTRVGRMWTMDCRALEGVTVSHV
jgi:hypothetical protein